MSSKFTDFLGQNQIDPRRLLSASRELERLRPEDRAIRHAKLKAKVGKAEGTATDKDKPVGERRSGRPVTRRLIQDLQAGKPVSGPAKTRLTRAVNHLLAQKKKEPVDVRVLFSKK